MGYYLTLESTLQHRCGVKMFRFSCGYHASTNLKKLWSSKLDKFTLFTLDEKTDLPMFAKGANMW